MFKAVKPYCFVKKQQIDDCLTILQESTRLVHCYGYEEPGDKLLAEKQKDWPIDSLPYEVRHHIQTKQ